MNPVRILVADDYELVLHGVVSVLSRAHPEWEIAALASSGEQAIEMARRANPNVAILDLAMPDRTGLEVAEDLIALIPGISVLILTSQATEAFHRRLRKAGIRGCVNKADAVTCLVDVLERILAGEAFVAPPASAEPQDPVGPSDAAPAGYLLTARELTVMRLVAEGHTNKVIATQLGLSIRTVESHRANLLHKLGINTLGDLVRIALREGIV